MTQAEKEEEGEKKVTVMMILEVDLKCYSCYKKVKKLLWKYPQIRDRVFDEDKNKVTITVVCYNPEKFRDELCCKGGKVIHTIEILKPEPEPEPEPEQQSPACGSSPPPQDHNPKEGNKTEPPPPPPPDDNRVPTPPPDDNLVPPPPPNNCEKLEPGGKTKHPTSTGPACCQECYEGQGGGPCHYGYGRHGPPPVSVCCQECSEGRGGGPCHYGYGRDRPPPVLVCCQGCSEGRGGGPCHYGYGRCVPVPPPPGPCFVTYGYPYIGNRPLCVTRCDDYLSEENPQGCSII